jgi:hypothetical protein
MTNRDTERPPIQDQIDGLSRTLAHLEVELMFTMKYCRAASLALGAIATVGVIDQERALYLERQKQGPEEDTQPSVRLKVAP